MGNLIKIDFNNPKRQASARRTTDPVESDSFRKFEESMRRYERLQRFKTAGLMVGFSFLIIMAMALPFIFNYVF